MSILIKGKTIPQGCGDCLLLARCVTYSDYCKVLDVDIDVVNSTYKHPNCPLVEVKEPHGRLIDGDAYCEDLLKEAHRVLGLLKPETIERISRTVDDLKKYPAIIEAEGSENE